MLEKKIEGVRKTAKFTLIELLVVIAIIGILAAMLMPALGRARTAAFRTQSISNVRQISQALHMYAGNYGDSLPFRMSNAQWIESANAWNARNPHQVTSGTRPNFWSEVLVEEDYIAHPAVYWSAARDVPFDIVDGMSTGSYRTTGYGLGQGVSGHEHQYRNLKDGTSGGTDNWQWQGGTSSIHAQPLRLGQGDAPPAFALLMVGEQWDRTSYGDDHGTFRANAVRSSYYMMTGGFFNYDGHIVRSFVDGSVLSNSDTAARRDPNALGYNTEFTGAGLGMYSTGPYSGEWLLNRNDMDHRAPWFHQWRSGWSM